MEATSAQRVTGVRQLGRSGNPSSTSGDGVWLNPSRTRSFYATRTGEATARSLYFISRAKQWENPPGTVAKHIVAGVERIESGGSHDDTLSGTTAQDDVGFAHDRRSSA